MKPLPTDRNITYQRQYRSCGNPHCHCMKGGKQHGPYIYAYWHDDKGKFKSQYVGKTLPGEQERTS